VTGKTRIVLLYGGRSAEHPVSVVSARSVMEALDPERFEVIPVAITRRGNWLLSRTSPLQLGVSGGQLPVVDEDGDPVTFRPEHGRGALVAGGGGGGAVPQALGGIGDVDVVLPILHGPYGEDGTVQGLLELADLPYVGSGVLASALAMDKAMAKIVLAQAGLPQVPYVTVREHAWQADPDSVYQLVAERLTYPVFVKPARLGSSIGIGKAHGAGDLAAALETAFAHDGKVLIEQGVVAREVECGVLGSLDAPEASVVGEIVPCHEFYDFEAKYLDESKLLIPAPLPAQVSERVRELALRAYTALDCEGFARVDCFYDERSGEVLLNEVNTIPGFTPKSMFPMLWAASGLPYPDLIARLVSLAIDRHRQKKR
jgi:D-alanine-D-alanine ligase